MVVPLTLLSIRSSSALHCGHFPLHLRFAFVQLFTLKLLLLKSSLWLYGHHPKISQAPHLPYILLTCLNALSFS